jgi:hypothetical protein
MKSENEFAETPRVKREERKARKIKKDHKGLYLSPPYNHGKQTKIEDVSSQDVRASPNEAKMSISLFLWCIACWVTLGLLLTVTF